MKRLAWGGDRRSSDFKASRDANGSGKYAAYLGTLGRGSRATIERMRAVMDSGEEDIIARYRAGEIATYTAYRMVKERYALPSQARRRRAESLYNWPRESRNQ